VYSLQQFRTRAMQGGLLPAPSEPSPEAPLVEVLEGRDVPIGEDDSHPPAPLETSPPGFLPGSPVHEADLDAALDSDTGGQGFEPQAPHPSKRFASKDRRGSMRGAVLSHPGTGGADDIRLLPTSAVVRGTFTMRGELLHAFISYRVATEGMVLTLHQALLHSRPLSPPAAQRVFLTRGDPIVRAGRDAVAGGIRTGPRVESVESSPQKAVPLP